MFKVVGYAKGFESPERYKGYKLRFEDKDIYDYDYGVIHSDEVFERVKDFEDYLISNYGYMLHKRARDGEIVFLMPLKNTSGYKLYAITQEGRKITRTAQRFVAEAFVENPYPEEDFELSDLQVHHKDGDKENNYYRNLMWLCKSKHGRRDHDFIHSLERVAYHNEYTGKYYTYKDVEMLLKRIDVSILEFIDIIKDCNEREDYCTDGNWCIYRVNGHSVAIEYKGEVNDRADQRVIQ